uniref:Uncharacterized protein n=1 Tax=Vespula pensylvanica TaxID=30213 RepID=A0A834KLY4_VESPE|nr:hypothetical protein H0235_013927 [Vespula pensylvanica]
MIMTAEAAVTATTAAQQQQQPQQQQRALRLISRANLGACIQWVSAVNAGKHPPAMAVLVVWLPLREPARQVFIPFAVMTSTSSKAVRVCQGSPRFARDSISEDPTLDQNLIVIRTLFGLPYRKGFNV